MGDGNDRVTLETSLRFGLVPDLYLVYGGGLLRFADPVGSYWSPDLFTLHSLGLELRRQWPTGLRLSAQALPGVAWAQEPGAPLTGFDRRTFQWQLGGQLGYLRPRWDLGLEGAWGRDRGGIYSSWWWSLRARYRW